MEGLQTVATLEGRGASVQSMLPSEAVRLIEEGVRSALVGPAPAPLTLPKEFNFRLSFNKTTDAYAKSFFPGARMVSDTVLEMETRNYFDVLTFLWFAAQ